jgi:hypothetical protein
MKPYIRHYPAPPRSRYDKRAIQIITIFSASGLIMATAFAIAFNYFRQ